MINHKNKKHKSYSFLLCIFLMYIVIWTLSPPLFVNDIARALALVSMLAILLREFFKSNNRGKYLFIMFIYIFITGILGIYIQGFYYININAQLYIFLGMAFICANNILLYHTDRYGLDKIFYVVLILYPVWMIITLITYETDPFISRELSGNRVADAYYWSLKGVGGFAMVYSLVFYNIILLYTFKFFKKIKQKSILILLNYILSLFVILKAGYSIAILATLFGTLIILLIRNNRMINAIIVLFVLITIFILLYTFLDTIVQFLLSISEDTLYESKIKDIIYSIQNRDAMGSLNNRMVRYQYSIDCFKRNILFGSSMSGQLLSGGHSLFLDTFAKFGLIGGVPLLYLVFYYPISCIKNNRAFPLSLAMLILILFIGFTNPMAAAIGTIFYVIYPGAVIQKELFSMQSDKE